MIKINIHIQSVLFYTHDEWRTTTLSYKNITLFLLFGVKASVVWERQMDWGRQRQTVILTHNFLAALCYLQGLMSSLLMRHTQPVFARGHLAHCGHGFLSANSASHCKLALTQDSHWLRTSHGHLHISFHHAHNFW